jgi:hypothetical protein
VSEVLDYFAQAATHNAGRILRVGLFDQQHMTASGDWVSRNQPLVSDAESLVHFIIVVLQ